MTWKVNNKHDLNRRPPVASSFRPPNKCHSLFGWDCGSQKWKATKMKVVGLKLKWMSRANFSKQSLSQCITEMSGHQKEESWFETKINVMNRFFKTILFLRTHWAILVENEWNTEMDDHQEDAAAQFKYDEKTCKLVQIPFVWLISRVKNVKNTVWNTVWIKACQPKNWYWRYTGPQASSISSNIFCLHLSFFCPYFLLYSHADETLPVSTYRLVYPLIVGIDTL